MSLSAEVAKPIRVYPIDPLFGEPHSKKSLDRILATLSSMHVARCVPLMDTSKQDTSSPQEAHEQELQLE
jgi:hypothetical protein